MKHGPFIILLAETLGLDVASVRQVARVIREAGFLTSGARGVNAPDMTLVDAARMVIALMTGEPPSRVLLKFHELRGLVPLLPTAGKKSLPVQQIDNRNIETLEDHLLWILIELSKPTPSRLLYNQTGEQEEDLHITLRVIHAYDTADLDIGKYAVSFVKPEISVATTDLASGRVSTFSKEHFRLMRLGPKPGIDVQRSIYECAMESIAEAVRNQRDESTAYSGCT